MQCQLLNFLGMETLKTEMRLLLLGKHLQIYVVLTPIFVFDAFAKTPGGVVKDKE